MKQRLLCIFMLFGFVLLLAGCEAGGLLSGSTRPDMSQSQELQCQPPRQGDLTATITTSLGTISVVLFPELAPMAVENFTQLATQGYFNGVPFHRVQPDFVIQSGDATGTGKAGASIWNNHAYPNEITSKLRHYSGALATANAPDGSVGNLSQFYIVSTPPESAKKLSADMLRESGLSDSAISTYHTGGGLPYLDGLDTVFGHVYDGMDVVDEINDATIDSSGRPVQDILIQSITVSTYTPSAADSSGASS